MIREVLQQYGPVNRFWFDGTSSHPAGTNMTDLWGRVYDAIRTDSPQASYFSISSTRSSNPASLAISYPSSQTIISPYRGDVCATTGTLYTNAGPPTNTSDTSNCAAPSETGAFFHPSEMHGITAQMGPDGNTDNVR